ncbi:MAG: hypothetical protein ABMB14_15140 [Myxococcota bacterium]
MRYLVPLLSCVVACDPGPSEADGPPSLAFVAPTDGGVVCGSPLEIVLDVQNFELVDPYGDEADAEPGTGHVDLSLNGQVVNMTSDTSFTLPDIVPGEYQLRAELVNADHTSIEPYTGQTIYFEVDASACGT